MEYQTLYDFGNEHLDLHMIVLPILLMVMGMIFLWRGYKTNNDSDIFGGLVAGFLGMILGIVFIPSDLSLFQRSKTIYEDRQYHVVEGVVEQFLPEDLSIGRKRESFTVQGISFRYSAYEHRFYGYHQGGLIGAGVFVRLSYYTANDDNIILKIERPITPLAPPVRVTEDNGQG